MSVLTDRPDRITQLVQRGQVLRERGLRADLFRRGVLGHRPLVDAAGQPVQRRADGGSEDVGDLGIGQRREPADGLDAEAMQLLLGHRSDAPQFAHGQAVQQSRLLVPRHHGDSVRLRQARCDLGDLLARPGAHRGHQPGDGRHLGAKPLTELLDLRRRGAGQRTGFAECLIERQLLEHRHRGAHGLEHPPTGQAVDHAAGRKHHRRGADQAPRLMHGHSRPGAENPGLVAGSGHHPTSAQTPDQYRTTLQRGTGELLHRREERVHVQVQDPSRAHTANRRRYRCGRVRSAYP